MKTKLILFFTSLFIVSNLIGQMALNTVLQPFNPPISYEEAGKRADAILAKLSIEEKIQLVNGYKSFFIKGFEKYNMPSLYMSDATQGVHIRKNLSTILKKSTAFPCPLALSSTWDPGLAYQYATSVGEECRAGDIAVLLGPGMNIYRISQCGRNFEYFGEDPFLAARMIENYVVGMQNTGTMTTLKHFMCNNTDYHRRNTNTIIDERTMHEIYLPAFKAGIDAGAMALMTSYNQINGEWCGQSEYVISKILRKDLGYKWLVMTDWWSVWDAEKIIKSGQDLEMPGEKYIQSDALNLLKEGKVKEADIDRMAKSIVRTCIAMGFYDRKVQDTTYLNNFGEHQKVALQTAREAIVLLKNDNNILPIKKETIKKMLLTGDYVETVPHGGGSAAVEGYDLVTMLAALKNEFGDKLEYIKNPTDAELKSADIVLLSVGTFDSEGYDRPFALPEKKEKMIEHVSDQNPKTVIIVNSGSGIQMTNWKVPALIYSWYPGQNGNIALVEILSGKTNPSGKLPITIEKKFEDSPGYPYIPEGDSMYTGWQGDNIIKDKIYTINYKEGVFVGYRWYESKKIEPLFHFGQGLSYTTFEYGKATISDKNLNKDGYFTVNLTITNTGKVSGDEIVQVYVQDVKASVPRPVKELKGFKRVSLNAGESKQVSISLTKKDLAFWDVKTNSWVAEPGDFNILVGSSSVDIRQTEKITLAQ